MIGLIGSGLVLFSIFTDSISIFLNIKLQYRFFYFSALSMISAFLLLVYSFAVSDFSLHNVFFNSTSLNSLVFRISGSWSSHEGSLMLFISLFSLINIISLHNTNIPSDMIRIQLIVASIIKILFCFLIYFISNPFTSFNFIPKEGVGMNPMLQDVGLIFHPPILYLGQVSYFLPFVRSLAILITKNNNLIIWRSSKNFSSFALANLTLGIGLGSWWAYRELGFGGFWFFDPVENISLIPWISGIILHHFLLITIRDGKCKNWTIIFSFLCFLSVLYGLFFVRSGILNSVHSFAFSKERGIFILVICTIITLLCLATFIKNANIISYLVDCNFYKTYNHYSLYEKLILIGNALFMILFILLFVSIIYPVYYNLYYKMDVVIDKGYFEKLFIPLNSLILIIAAIAPHVAKYGECKFLELVNCDHIISISLSIIASLIFNHYLNINLVPNLIIFSSIYLMSSTSLYLIRSSNYFRNGLKTRQISLFLGHFGFGLLAFSIAINHITSDKISFLGKIGDKISTNSMDVKFTNIGYSETKNYFRQIVEFWINDKFYDELIILKPENRLYKIENSLSSEVDIFSFITHDLYAVVDKIDGGIVHAEIHKQFMISFIWISCLMIVFSFFSTLIRKK